MDKNTTLSYDALEAFLVNNPVFATTAYSKFAADILAGCLGELNEGRDRLSSLGIVNAPFLLTTLPPDKTWAAWEALVPLQLPVPSELAIVALRSVQKKNIYVIRNLRVLSNGQWVARSDVAPGYPFAPELLPEMKPGHRLLKEFVDGLPNTAIAQFLSDEVMVFVHFGGKTNDDETLVYVLDLLNDKKHTLQVSGFKEYVKYIPITLGLMDSDDFLDMYKYFQTLGWK